MWEEFLDFIRLYRLGDRISRAEIHSKFYWTNSKTLDRYRSLLTKGGYLKPSNRPGFYIFERVPEYGLSTSQLLAEQKYQYNDVWVSADEVKIMAGRKSKKKNYFDDDLFEV
jgi:hypothetical protein